MVVTVRSMIERLHGYFVCCRFDVKEIFQNGLTSGISHCILGESKKEVEVAYLMSTHVDMDSV